MQYLKTYLKTITDRGNEKLAESISKTAEEVGNKYIKNFSFCSHEIGLLFGNVQSGKTGQMFGIMCKAADLGFPAFVLLTTDNVVLQQQTLDRVKADLTGFCICGENDAGLFIQNSLMQPAIIVLKKNYRVLKLWANIFASTGFMKGNPLFIIDDEADAASLNTLVNKGRQSSINKYLDAIKNGASSSIYLQVTGTPQAIFLQTMASGWHPYFTYYFAPGGAYLGGDFFFPKNTTAECISYLERIANPEHEVVIRHLAVSGQILASGKTTSNCLLHPSVRQAVHNKYAKAISDELRWCKEHLDDDFKKELANIYETLKPQKSSKVSFDELFATVKALLESDSVKVIVMNGKNEVDSEEYSSGSNIIVGGNTLGRGVTFPSLHTIYYTRTSKKPQADTMWQHSRMFGYDRDPGMMMVYIDEPLYKLFADINATNNSIISQIERGAENIKIYYPEGLNPTRANVLDNQKVYMLSGGTNYYPFNPDNDSIDALDTLLAPFDDKEPSYQINLRLMKEIFSHITSDDDFAIDSFVSILDTILAEKPSAQGVLIVRRGRDVAKGTGALLSPNDWSLGASFTDTVVLTMYKMTGRKGWNGKELWVPNIKLPNDIVYYDVKETDEEDISIAKEETAVSPEKSSISEVAEIVDTVKALSIMPPYAMEIYDGLKTIEWRSWKTDYRGDLLICSSSRKCEGCISGYALCMVELVDVVPFTKKHLRGALMDEIPEPAGYAWILRNVRNIVPFPHKGKLHIYDVDASLVKVLSSHDSENANKEYDEYYKPLIIAAGGEA